MSKKKLLFIFIIEVFVFIAGLLFFIIVFGNSGSEDIDSKLIIYSMLLLIIAIIVYIITSKIYKDIEYIEISNISFEQDKHYFRDIIKEYSVAELGFIDKFEFSYFDDVVAMLLKLENLKTIKIEGNRINVLDYSKLDLKESEKYLISCVKDGHLDDLDNATLKKIVENECIEDNLLEPIPKRTDINKLINDVGYLIAIAVFAPISILACLEIISSFKSAQGIMYYLPYFIIFLTVIFSITAFVRFIMSSGKNKVEFILLDSGKEIYSKIKGLENYIKEFSNLDSKEKEHLELWDDYLIYSVMFGLNKQIPDKYLKILKSKPDIPFSNNSSKGIYLKP